MEPNNTHLEKINEESDKVRAMIEKYQSVREDRVKMLLTLQGLLFMALAFSWDKDPILATMISICGLISTIAFFAFLDEVDAAISRILKWWKKRVEAIEAFNGLPTCDLLSPRKKLLLVFPDAVSMMCFSIGGIWGAVIMTRIFG